MNLNHDIKRMIPIAKLGINSGIFKNYLNDLYSSNYKIVGNTIYLGNGKTISVSKAMLNFGNLYKDLGKGFYSNNGNIFGSSGTNYSNMGIIYKDGKFYKGNQGVHFNYNLRQFIKDPVTKNQGKGQNGGTSTGSKITVGNTYTAPEGLNVLDFLNYLITNGFGNELGRFGADGKYGALTDAAYLRHKDDYAKFRNTTPTIEVTTTNPQTAAPTNSTQTLLTTTPAIDVTLYRKNLDWLLNNYSSDYGAAAMADKLNQASLQLDFDKNSWGLQGVNGDNTDFYSGIEGMYRAMGKNGRADKFKERAVNGRIKSKDIRRYGQYMANQLRYSNLYGNGGILLTTLVAQTLPTQLLTTTQPATLSNTLAATQPATQTNTFQVPGTANSGLAPQTTGLLNYNLTKPLVNLDSLQNGSPAFSPEMFNPEEVLQNKYGYTWA